MLLHLNNMFILTTNFIAVYRCGAKGNMICCLWFAFNGSPIITKLLRKFTLLLLLYDYLYLRKSVFLNTNFKSLPLICHHFVTTQRDYHFHQNIKTSCATELQFPWINSQVWTGLNLNVFKFCLYFHVHCLYNYQPFKKQIGSFPANCLLQGTCPCN